MTQGQEQSEPHRFPEDISIDDAYYMLGALYTKYIDGHKYPEEFAHDLEHTERDATSKEIMLLEIARRVYERREELHDKVSQAFNDLAVYMKAHKSIKKGRVKARDKNFFKPEAQRKSNIANKRMVEMAGGPVIKDHNGKSRQLGVDDDCMDFERACYVVYNDDNEANAYALSALKTVMTDYSVVPKDDGKERGMSIETPAERRKKNRPKLNGPHDNYNIRPENAIPFLLDLYVRYGGDGDHAQKLFEAMLDPEYDLNHFREFMRDLADTIFSRRAVAHQKFRATSGIYFAYVGKDSLGQENKALSKRPTNQMQVTNARNAMINAKKEMLRVDEDTLAFEDCCYALIDQRTVKGWMVTTIAMKTMEYTNQKYAWPSDDPKHVLRIESQDPD